MEGGIGKARAAPAFAGFGPQALPFLRAIGFHQSKDWFDENRAIYESDLRQPMENLLLGLSDAFAEAGLPIRGDRNSIFRIRRDTRFSKNKQPYKTSVGAVLSRDGSRRSQGFVYVHVDPEGCFLAAGFWQPEPGQALALRSQIRRRPAVFRSVQAKLAEAGLPLSEGDPLTRMPKGFETVPEPDLAEAIRMRNLIVRRPVAAEAIADPRFTEAAFQFGLAAEPLLRFGWAALETPPD